MCPPLLHLSAGQALIRELLDAPKMGVTVVAEETFWLDTRWMKPGWQEAFRARLSGWLPIGWVQEGVRLGVIEYDAERRMIEVTTYGREITDLDLSLISEDTIKALAATVAIRGGDDAWFNSDLGQPGGWLAVARTFPIDFRERFEECFQAACSELTKQPVK
jgi:hypothetical protein